MVAVGSAGESGVGVNDDVALEQLVVAEVVLGPGVDEQVLRVCVIPWGGVEGVEGDGRR